MKQIAFFLSMFLLAGISVFAQVAVNTDGSFPDNSAVLDVKSTFSGMLVPRMTFTDRENIASPANGLMVFCTDSNHFYMNKGTPLSKNWVMMSSQWMSNGTDIYFT